MSRHLIGASLSVITVVLASSGWAGVSAEPDMGPLPPWPAVRGVPLPPGRHVFGPQGPAFDLTPSLDARMPAANEGQPKASEPPPPAKIPTRQERLDGLFTRLSKTSDAGEASGIAAVIERIWLESGSDTADLLMARAVAAMGDDRRDIAGALLDKILLLEPDWAEAWNRRATLRFLEDDDAGSMEDLTHVLTLEPRHFGALSGLGFILKRNGMAKGALAALRSALAIYPENPDIQKAVDELTPDVEGREL